MAMEASMSRTVSMLFSARRCIVASAAKDIEIAQGGRRRRSNDVKQQRGSHGQLAVAAATTAAAMTGQCHAAAAAAAPERQWQEVAEGVCRAVAVVGELDPATAKAAIGVAGPALSAFGFLFIARIVMSWYPRLPVREFPYVVAYAPTEPLLAVTRKVIPPLGGVDVTPVVWFGLVSFASEILVGPQGLLVLLSQQKP
uniref:Protein COFACTOR ASSEMBLY OF COMPLEX C SUBUNIT B CCB3, chloroplastic n=1 Tax=Oryza glumipatula TaxID=40148 RepID=A0A0D9YKH9_9ORYZ